MNIFLKTFTYKNIIKFINSIFGIGFFPAGGSIATLFSFFFYNIFLKYYSIIFIYFLFIFIFFLVDLNVKFDIKKDPSYIVTDEFIATVLGLTFLSKIQQESIIFNQYIFILLFRFFDIKKPLGIKKIENIYGATGIILDDIVAAIYSILVLFLLIKFFNF